MTTDRATAAAVANAVADVLFNEGHEAGAEGPWLVRGAGCTVEDADGHTFLDMSMGSGTHLLGHAHPAIVEAVRRQAAEGTLFSAPAAAVHRMGEMLHTALPGLDGFVFCNSDSEATMRACRLARAVTGRPRIAMFSGGWHGSHDLLLLEEDAAADAAEPVIRYRTAGVPRRWQDDVLLPYNDPHALEMIAAHAGKLAMVLVEPVQGSNPRDDIGPFLADLRTATRDNGVLLGFDEVITGFRLARGGRQQFFGVDADIACYGKVIGGGLPIGLVGGRSEIMEAVRRPVGAAPERVFMGGTFSANPLTIAAGTAVLDHLFANPDLFEALNGEADELRRSVNAFAAERGIAARMMGAGSVSRVVFTDRPIASRLERDRYEPAGIHAEFARAMRARGVLVAGNGILFLSTAHDAEAIAQFRAVVAETLADFAAEGRFDGR